MRRACCVLLAGVALLGAPAAASAHDDLRLLPPGRGGATSEVARDLTLSRDYVVHLRETTGRAVRERQSFDDARAAADWSKYRNLPAFSEANRINAFGPHLLFEQEELHGARR